jgi:hypothetical protein
MALIPTKALPFTQAKHPTKNLGSFAHQPRLKENRTKTSVPKPQATIFHGPPGDPQDFKPKQKPLEDRNSRNAKMVNDNNMDYSDQATEQVGSQLGPANVNTAPPSYKPRKTVKKSASPAVHPFFGKL